MTSSDIEQLFGRLEYDQDVRRAPDERRRGQFRAGWEDATTRGEIYAADTLTTLTWHNLGYRVGKHFGPQTPEQIDAAFEVLATLYSAPEPAKLPASDPAPTPQQYAAAFRKINNLTDCQIQMLRMHYNSPNRTTTATKLAHAVGFPHYSLSNAHYGRLGRLIGEQLDYNPMQERLGTLVTFEKRQGEWHWLMRPEVAQALESLGWVEGTGLLLPEEIAATLTLVEGAVCRVSVNAYERNPEARRRCIERHGTNCAICAFNFGNVYGEVGEDYIHVHHLRALSNIGQEYVVDPINDLRPVCPNCHAILHRRNPPYSIEDVYEFLKSRRTIRTAGPACTLPDA